jgi:hypothetical protein
MEAGWRHGRGGVRGREEWEGEGVVRECRQKTKMEKIRNR